MHLLKNIQDEKKVPYYPTEADTEMWFHIINRYIFDNQLSPFQNIVIKRMSHWWACVLHDDPVKNDTIELRMHMKFPNKLHFIDALAHEMVHKWQLEINQDSGYHNKYFFSWRQKFDENGLNLSRSL